VAENALVGTGAKADPETVYREHGDRLWRAVLSFAGDPEVASDAVAEAFAQLLRRGAEVRDPLAWVWRAAFRLAAGELKDRRQETGMPQDPVYEMPERFGEVQAALARLPEKQRAAVVLHYYADRPVSEIARTLGTTGPAVRVNLMRGRKRLRGLLVSGDE
jgi:RNA polymerase sigma-70 factor (ECF subfamily)